MQRGSLVENLPQEFRHIDQILNRGMVIRGRFQRVATAAEGVGEKEDRVWVLFEEDIKGEELEVGHHAAIVNF